MSGGMSSSEVEAVLTAILGAGGIAILKRSDNPTCHARALYHGSSIDQIIGDLATARRAFAVIFVDCASKCGLTPRELAELVDAFEASQESETYIKSRDFPKPEAG